MHIFLQSFFYSTHFIVIIDLACYCKTIDGLQLRHSFFPPKRHYKALDLNLIVSNTFVDTLALIGNYQERFKQLT